jgi:hypothetical protein
MRPPNRRSSILFSLIRLCTFAIVLGGLMPIVGSSEGTDVAALLAAIRMHAKALESSSGMHDGFEAFRSEYKLPAGSVDYSDFVIARLTYEATRDAGFWGLHWSITNKPPNSDAIWSQWATEKHPSFAKKTATAECDELSALYAFLVEREGVRSVGLFWPYPNHTVAVWTIHPAPNRFARVVVPTSQIFLTADDDFGRTSFNPWTQKTIYEYTRRDAPDSFVLPKPLFDLFVQQMDKYGGASDATLQKLRYYRDAVLQGEWTPDEAARAALATHSTLASPTKEDIAALQYFAEDMR